MFKVYGENGITFKIAVKLDMQKYVYTNLLNIICNRYKDMHGETIISKFRNNVGNVQIYLFPNFGKRGRSGADGETCFGEPDMIISTDKANYIFELETKPFMNLLKYKGNILRTDSLAYQLCRFYQLGSILSNLTQAEIIDPSARTSKALYEFIRSDGRRTKMYYFNFGNIKRKASVNKVNRHSFERMVLNLLGKEFYIISITNDCEVSDAVGAFNKMMNVVGKNKYETKHFIVMTYKDIQSRECFGENLQLSLNRSRQRFQAINIKK